MTRKELLEFVQGNPVFYLATCVDNSPDVRAMTLFAADEHGVIFNTCKSKRVYRQLVANPAVALCFYSPARGLQVRIRGKAQLERGHEIRKQIAEKYPVLCQCVLRSGSEALATFHLVDARAWIWQIESDFASATWANDEVASIWMAMYDGMHVK